MRRPCRRPHDEPIDDPFVAGAFRTSYMVSCELVFVALFRAGAKSSVLDLCSRYECLTLVAAQRQMLRTESPLAVTRI